MKDQGRFRKTLWLDKRNGSKPIKPRQLHKLRTRRVRRAIQAPEPDLFPELPKEGRLSARA